MIFNFYQTGFAAKFISFSCGKTSRQKQNNDNIYIIGNFLRKLQLDGMMYRNVLKK